MVSTPENPHSQHNYIVILQTKVYKTGFINLFENKKEMINGCFYGISYSLKERSFKRVLKYSKFMELLNLFLKMVY